MRINIDHETVYDYDGVIIHSAQYLRLTPPGNESHRVIRWHIDAPGHTAQWRDAYGNCCMTLVVDDPREQIRIHAIGQVETRDTSGVLSPAEADPPPDIFLRHTAATRPGEELRDFALGFAGAVTKDRLKGLHEIVGGLRERVAYQAGATHVATTANEAFELGAGVCQDHTHLFLSVCRHLGIPARYVSGYLCDDATLSAGGPASHAWAAAWVDDLGWVSFDVSNECCGTERHVGLAIGLDYADTAPMRGIRTGGTGPESMTVSLRVVDSQ